MPPEVAGELSDTEHVVELAPVNVLLPHDIALIVGEIVEVAPLTLMDVVFETEPWVAMSVTVCVAVTADMLAEKLAFVAPEATVTEEGTVTTLLLLARVTANPVLGAAALKVTVHVSAPAPIIDEDAQLSPEREAVFDPLPCNLIVLEVVSAVLVVASTLN